MENPMEPTKLADRMFDAYIEFVALEDEMINEVLNRLGIDPNEPDDWPLDDVQHDFYDHSFELKNVTVGWEPTAEGLENCWELGFDRCWINYKDGTEKYYTKVKIN